eukprot:Plantae.Rhodophyta-Purpureofilum_apyrenoidigerum.ctg16928.p1 GENE.Plantae.Rhodophyta-Purpureofilum_apyrenoidigerum.ctg16928~~Plantae.Rhodophyta-Purpureofilum_apyrenoidigerum.ctg16928.p1  ORF type:complete len:489 (-),score=59.70 Plantae.Rhodophyta-Purpureofilum_apyrenoidigerum.ctg16928:72-1448(-)
MTVPLIRGMTRFSLNELDDRCHEWLLFRDQRDYVPNLAGADQTLVIDQNESKPELRKDSMAMVLMAEVDASNFVLGRLSADFPVAKILKLGEALEQRFCVYLKDNQPELVCSSLYNNDVILMSRLNSALCENWRENLHFEVFKAHDLTSPLVSGSMFALNHAVSKEMQTGLKSIVGKNRVEGLQIWKFFCYMVSVVTGETTRKAVLYSCNPNKEQPILQRVSTINLQAFTAGPRVDDLRSKLINKSMVNVSLYFRMSMSDMEDAFEDEGLMSGETYDDLDDGPLMITCDATQLSGESSMGDSTARVTVLDDDEAAKLDTSASLLENSAHDGKPQCVQCGAQFERRYDRDRHIRTVHLHERRFHCKTCGKKFSQSAHLKSHNETVHEHKRDSFCEKCQQTFSTKYKLQRHIRSVHFRERPFHCELCSSSYFQRSDLIRHKEHRHKAVDILTPAASGINI